MTPKDLREKTDTELKKLKAEWKTELFHLKVKKVTGQLEKTHRIREVKKDLARLLTIEQQKAGA